jgi:ribosomal-protein-alanine N-acetyltransferase
MAARAPLPPGVEIVTASMAHADVIAELHARCFDEAWSPFTVRQVLNMPGAFGLIARDVDVAGEEDLAGFVLARMAADECEILSLATAPAWREQGVGRMLLDACIARVASQGAISLFLEVAEDNLVAQQLYRQRGFNAVGRRDGYYRRREGPAVAALTLALTLTP